MITPYSVKRIVAFAAIVASIRRRRAGGGAADAVNTSL